MHVRPPGGSHAKFDSRSRKGIYLGFPKDTTKNIISYHCKTQSITATSSAEAEFLAAVLTAKQAKCPPRSVLKKLKWGAAHNFTLRASADNGTYGSDSSHRHHPLLVV